MTLMTTPIRSQRGAPAMLVVFKGLQTACRDSGGERTPLHTSEVRYQIDPEMTINGVIAL